MTYPGKGEIAKSEAAFDQLVRELRRHRERIGVDRADTNLAFALEDSDPGKVAMLVFVAIRRAAEQPERSDHDGR